jgi:hypothetical protein
MIIPSGPNAPIFSDVRLRSRPAGDSLLSARVNQDRDVGVSCSSNPG